MGPQRVTDSQPLTRTDGWVAALLTLGVWVLYLACTAHGDRAWDSLVTAGVVAHWREVPVRYFFHFAHFLVIPFSLPFYVLGPWRDPLLSVSAAESMATALTTALLYLSLRRFAQPRAYSLAGALVYPLTFAAWLGSTAGEEKAMAAAAVALSIYCLMDHLELFGQPARLSAPLVGLTLSLATFVHLMNALLFPATALTLLVLRKNARSWWWLVVFPGLLVALAYVLVGTVLYGVPLLEFRGWLTQYHEEARPAAEGTNLVFLVLAGWTKSFLGLEWITLYPVFGPALGVALLAALGSLWRRIRPLTVLVGTYLALHCAHFVHYEPAHFESWVHFVYLSLLLILCALTGGARLAVLGLLVLQLVCMGPSILFPHRSNVHEQVVLAARASVEPGTLLLHNRPFLQYYFWLVPGPTELFGNLYPITREKLRSFNFYRNPYSALMCWTAHTPAELNGRLAGSEKIAFMCLEHPAVVDYYRQFMELEPLTTFTVEPARFAVFRVRRFLDNPSVTLPDVER